jgi:hypothetical protein
VPVAVSVGEFVVPKETVSWFGEKHFHKLTEKAELERAEQAVPTEAQPAAGGIPGRPGMAGGGMVMAPDRGGLAPDRGGLAPDRGGIAGPGGLEHFPGIMPTPGPPGGPIYGIPPGERFTPIRPMLPGPRDRFSPPISMRPQPPIPHYGPDPGRGVGLPRGYPIPQNPYPAPDPGRGVSLGPIAPIQDPYGPDPGRGVQLPRGYPIPQNPYPAPAVPAVGRM